jgi:hypothetical protein
LFIADVYVRSKEVPMPQVIASEVFESTLTLLRETFEGAQGPSTYYLDTAPGSGFFGTIERLDAKEASRPISKSGTTIAGHVHHAGLHLEMTTAWIRGERSDWDWSANWTVRAVGEAEWRGLREALRRQYDALLRAIEREPAAIGEALPTTMGAIAHAAYHLGAVRLAVAGA